MNEKQQHWQKHIQAWQNSKLSQNAYCEQQHLNYNTFVYWRSQLKKFVQSGAPDQTTHLIPVHITPSSAAGLMLKISQQYSIEVHPGFNAECLRELINVVQQTT